MTTDPDDGHKVKVMPAGAGKAQCDMCDEVRAWVPARGPRRYSGESSAWGGVKTRGLERALKRFKWPLSLLLHGFKDGSSNEGCMAQSLA